MRGEFREVSGTITVPADPLKTSAEVGSQCLSEHLLRDAVETITFHAGKPGSYHYVCPMPGHAQMDIVRTVRLIPKPDALGPG